MEISSVRMPAIGALDFGSAAGGAKRADASADGASFASLIQQSLDKVNATQGNAEAMTHQYQLNPESVSLEDAMLSLQKANISFQTTVQVRNKLVAAYNDIMNMQL
jgi:flagellar hook-basal body complex protein FliE